MIPTDIKILSGKILLYRVFDIGEDVNLAKLSEALDAHSIPGRLKLHRDKHQAVIINNAPVHFGLGNTIIDINGHSFKVDLIGKVWEFGTLSVTFDFNIPAGTGWNELIEMASVIQQSESIDNLAREKARLFTQQINHTMSKTNEWEINEDYVIYYFEKLNIGPDALELVERADIPALILTESTENLSVQMRRNILENKFQYSQSDLAIIDWNSAVIVEPSGSMDIPDVIEFALNQLLEMRYYDDLLDKKLNVLYNSIEHQGLGLLSVFSDRFANLSKDAGQTYLEIADIVETIENSLKVVGDFYLSTIFRATSYRFRFSDWQKSIDNKLNNLAEISKLLHGRIAERRSNLLELIIIMIIAFEAFPLLLKILKG